MPKNIDKTKLFNGKTVPVDWGYQNISLLPVPRTDSLNSLAEALCRLLEAEHSENQPEDHSANSSHQLVSV